MPETSSEKPKSTQPALSVAGTEHVSDETKNQDPSATQTRKRTRATAEQLAVLEDTFSVNVSPNSKLRKQLAEQLQMSERSIQIWFQNRRAKVKHMQKRAQMQMQQASIRAQLYHYHQQQYSTHPPYQGSNLMPLPPHHYHHHHVQQQQQQQQQQLVHQHQHQPHQHHPYYRPYPAVARMPLPRSQSVDPTFGEHHPAAFSSSSVPPSLPAAVYHATPAPTPPPSSCYPLWPENHLHPSDSINASPSSSPTSHFHPFANTTIPTLVSVPDAGPTAMLATAQDYQHISPPSSADVWCSPDILDRAQSIVSIDPNHAAAVAAAAAAAAAATEFSTPARALSNPIVTTIDPSSLVLTPPTSTSSDSMSSGPEEDADAAATGSNNMNQDNAATAAATAGVNATSIMSLNATTLTVGTWHRLKLQSNDLLCTYEPDRRIFSWMIADNGCRFKMETALDAVASIEYIASDCDVLADIHFDISEPPLFYMEQKGEWVQCSDFTENKQASRFFRHTLKGVAHHMKQELLNLVQTHDETRRMVRFIETPIHPDPLYWSHPYVTEQCAFFG